MTRVTHIAEDCNAIPTANNCNNAAFNKSVLDENIPVSSSETKKEDKAHGFSNTLAQLKNSEGALLGWNSAIILRYLSALSRQYGKTIDGKRWIRVNLDHISEQYPYLGRSTVDDNIARLEEFGCCEKQNGIIGLKSRKNDRTRCYHIPKKWMDAAEEEPRYFRSSVAQQLNVPCAVIYYNFCHWIGECTEQEEECQVKLSPARLVELLPFSRSTIKRCLKTLEIEECIHPVPGKCSWYTEKAQEVRGSNPDDRGPNPDEKGPNPDVEGPNPDNYIDCSIIIDELEISSKPKPAASVFKFPSDDKKADDEQVHLLHKCIAPFADEQDRKEMRHEEITSGGFGLIINSSSGPTKVASEHSENYSSSTSDISGEAFDVKGEWPDVPNWQYLHAKNQSLSVFVSKMENLPGGVRRSLLSTVHDICTTVLAQVDQEITDVLYENGDKEEIIQTLLPYHQRFFSLSKLTIEHSLFDILYYGSLEAMVGAMLWEQDRLNKYSHPLTMLNNVTYRLHMVFWRRAENLRTAAVKEEFAQWREEHASRDEHKENDASLSPAEKMRVFRNALNTKNKVGWIFYDQTHRTDQIDVSKLGLQRIQKLFELNPNLTPADLLPLMDACMKEFINRPKPAKKFVRGVHWHARMGHKLHIFASYLETIVKQVGMESPVEVYLSQAGDQQELGVALAA